MAVLYIVAVACFIAGVWASTTWLPPLAEGPVGTLAYFVVCGLAGAVLAVFGIHVWQVVHRIEAHGLYDHSESVAAAVDGLADEPGVLAALALIAYVVAPKARKCGADE